MQNKKIAKNLRLLRHKKGITQSEVEKSVGISLSVITNYELGICFDKFNIKCFHVVIFHKESHYCF